MVTCKSVRPSLDMIGMGCIMFFTTRFADIDFSVGTGPYCGTDVAYCPVEEVHGDPMVGLAAVLSACFTSGLLGIALRVPCAPRMSMRCFGFRLAGVYLEKILKQTDSSIWMRSVRQMCHV